MIVAYTELPDDAGGWPRPLVDVTVGDLDEAVFPCLVDSGSLNSLVPRWIGEVAGLDLSSGDTRDLFVAGTVTEASFYTVSLSVAAHTWEAPLGFCNPWPYAWGLLGQLSFFRYFTVTFRAADYEFEVAPIMR